jgi:VanZ family protein
LFGEARVAWLAVDALASDGTATTAMHSPTMRRLGLAVMIANLAGAVVVTLWPFAFDLAPAVIARKWGHVEWVLYYRDDDGRVIIDRDLVLNLALLFPFGAGLAWWRVRRTWVVTWALGLGLGLATAIEAAQLLTPHRVTQLADVWRNGLGCVIGALFGVALRRRWPGDHVPA